MKVTDTVLKQECGLFLLVSVRTRLVFRIKARTKLTIIFRREFLALPQKAVRTSFAKRGPISVVSQQTESAALYGLLFTY